MQIHRSLHKTLLLSISVLAATQWLRADSVACAVDGFPPGTGQPVGQTIPCGQAPFSITANLPALAISGNTLTASLETMISSTSQSFSRQYTATIGFDDTFRIPNSPAGDVLQLQADYSSGIKAEPGSTVSLLVQIGPGSGSSPEINLNPATDSCPPGGCRYSATLPANAFSSISLQGKAWLLALPPSELNGEFVETGGDFTFTRFKADGVTPDAFTNTPEPASFALAVAGLFLLSLVKVRRNRTKLDPASQVFAAKGQIACN